MREQRFSEPLCSFFFCHKDDLSQTGSSHSCWASLMAQMVKNLPQMQIQPRIQVGSLGREDPLEKGMATHSSLLVRRIPRIEESGRSSPWGHKESDITK